MESIPLKELSSLVEKIHVKLDNSGGSPAKDEGWLDRPANALEKLLEKAVEAVKAIVICVLGAILSFLKKTIGFVAEHTWALIVFVAGVIGWWLMQKVKKV